MRLAEAVHDYIALTDDLVSRELFACSRTPVIVVTLADTFVQSYAKQR
jgi:hypothetical protein